LVVQACMSIAVPEAVLLHQQHIAIPIISVDTVNERILTWDVYVRDANLCVGITSNNW
jgi:hypothetical protein